MADEITDDKTDADEKWASTLSPKELLTRVRRRACLMVEADKENRDNGMEDMKFLHRPGHQWQPEVKADRGDRPCYEINKTRIKAKRIVNEMRANRPTGRSIPVKDATKEDALVMDGIGLGVLYASDFDTIADYAGEYQVGAGLGAWRIVTEYGDDTFDQDIILKPISNPFNLYWDPASVNPQHLDAQDWCLFDRMPKTEFNVKHKGAKKINFDAGDEFDDEADWVDTTTVRICEYHWREPYKKNLIQLVGGQVLDADSEGGQLVPPDQIVKRRTADCHRIMMCVASGDAILEAPIELKGRYHRFVVAHGEWIIIDGKPQWCGVTRYAKDAQRAYNVASTAITETIATAPNAHYWATAAQSKGHVDNWKKAITENLPIMLYNGDPQAPGPPQRVGGADVPMALIQEAQIRDQELKDVMGVYDASLGDRSQEHSGVAISRRAEQGQIVNFNFPDNMAKAKQLTLKIINDIIPFYFDTERVVRTIGKDGSEDFIKVNTVGVDPNTGQPVLMNDLTRGRYDVVVSVGPSYSTQRQQAAETYTQMAAQDPMLMQTAGDIVYKSMDLPHADEIAERRQAMLPPQIQAILSKDKEMPPEVKQGMAQVDAMKQQVEQHGQLIQQAAQEAGQAKAEADKAISDLKVQRAQFDAQVSQELAKLAQQEAQLTLDQAKLMVATHDSVQQPPAPTHRMIRMRRVNGELVGEMMDVPQVTEGGE